MQYFVIEPSCYGELGEGTIFETKNDSREVAQLDAEGRYRLSHILAGEYRLTAMNGLNSTDYLDPVEAPKLGANLVVVEAGKSVTSDLRLVRK